LYRKKEILNRNNFFFIENDRFKLVPDILANEQLSAAYFTAVSKLYIVRGYPWHVWTNLSLWKKIFPHAQLRSTDQWWWISWWLIRTLVVSGDELAVTTAYVNIYVQYICSIFEPQLWFEYVSYSSHSFDLNNFKLIQTIDLVWICSNHSFGLNNFKPKLSYPCRTTSRDIDFIFLSNWKEYDRSDYFPFDYEPNGITFGS